MTVSVHEKLNLEKKALIASNRKYILAIIDTIRTCATQGLSLRGTKESGRIKLGIPEINDGNFRALLRYRALGDSDLKKKLDSSGRNAMYLSNRIQNQLIDIFKRQMQRKIVAKINKSKGFVVLADETIDVSGKEQLTIVIRYLDKIDGKTVIREDFLGFIEVSSCMILKLFLFSQTIHGFTFVLTSILLEITFFI